MSRALAASRTHWWGRDPVQDWTYDYTVLEPRVYFEVLESLADMWVGEPAPSLDRPLWALRFLTPALAGSFV